jgi:3-oxoacyl-[acyl-carrier protein] reductase
MSSRSELNIPDLAGKRILVTGASAGIGAAVALGFLGQGARVAIHYGANRAGAERVAAGAPDRAVVVHGDMADLADTERVVHEAARLLGGLDGIVNNAGNMLGRIPTEAATADHFDRVVDLNARSVWQASITAVPYLRQAGGGFIINTTSIAARNGGGQGAVLYAAAKSFVSNLTRGHAKEFVADGIRVNAVAPGVIQTAFHDRYTPAGLLSAQVGTIPMGRAGTPEECVGAYLFLASKELSGYLTGQVIEVNGGQLMV